MVDLCRRSRTSLCRAWSMFLPPLQLSRCEERRVVVTFETPVGGDSTTVSNALASGVFSIPRKKRFRPEGIREGRYLGLEQRRGKIEAANVNALASGAMAVYSTDSAFAVLKNDSSVVTGHASFGGNLRLPTLPNITAVYPTGSAFVALGTNKRAFAWGDSMCGGAARRSRLHDAVGHYGCTHQQVPLLLSEETEASQHGGFANDGPPQTVKMCATCPLQADHLRLTSSGAVIAWGDQLYGGNSMMSLTY